MESDMSGNQFLNPDDQGKMTVTDQFAQSGDNTGTFFINFVDDPDLSSQVISHHFQEQSSMIGECTLGVTQKLMKQHIS
jgi:hypothetical protein